MVSTILKKYALKSLGYLNMSLTTEPERDCCTFRRFLLNLLRKSSKRFKAISKLKKNDNNKITNKANICKKYQKTIFRGFQNETLKRYTERCSIERYRSFFKKMPFKLNHQSRWNIFESGGEHLDVKSIVNHGWLTRNNFELQTLHTG